MKIAVVADLSDHQQAAVHRDDLTDQVVRHRGKPGTLPPRQPLQPTIRLTPTVRSHNSSVLSSRVALSTMEPALFTSTSRTPNRSSIFWAILSRPWRRPHRHGGGAHPCPGPPPFLLPLLPPLHCGCSGQLRHNLALRALRRPRARSPCRCQSPTPLLRKKPTFSPPTEPTSPSSPSYVLQIDTRRVMLTLAKKGKTQQCLNSGSGRQCLSL